MNFNEHPIVLAFIVVGICALLAVAGVGKTLTIVICFVILITLMLYSGLKAEKEKKEKATQQNREKFCAECAQYKITNPAKLRSAEKKQRFERLVAKYHLTNLSQEELQQMVTQYHAMHTARKRQKNSSSKSSKNRKSSRLSSS